MIFWISPLPPEVTVFLTWSKDGLWTALPGKVCNSVPNVLFFRSQKLIIFWLQSVVCSRDALRTHVMSLNGLPVFSLGLASQLLAIWFITECPVPKGPFIVYGRGGPEEKVGGWLQIFLMDREWARKKIRRWNISFQNIFAARAAFHLLLALANIFSMNVDLCTLQEWASKNYGVMQSGPQIILSAPWVGREKFSRNRLFFFRAPQS